MHYVFLLLNALALQLAGSSFSPDFNRFLIQLYGLEAQRLLERLDFREQGSFGGREEANETIIHDPVVIVHGITNTASRFEATRTFLMRRGYTDAEIYGTTYGGGPESSLIFVTLKCQYMKQVRALISAVYLYTNRKVDVIAYSMGAPIARGALLGGFCDSEDMGRPLTELVDTFVSVAGANFGSSLCFIPLAVCNSDNGLHCSSRILVGSTCCGHLCSDLPHANDVFRLKDMGHDDVMDGSIPLQYLLITEHRPNLPYLQKFMWTKQDQDKSYTLFKFFS